VIHFFTHPSHRHTRSNDWLQQQFGCDRVVYNSPGQLSKYLHEIRARPPTAIILFQNDQLAEYLGQICPVVVVPMYDHAQHVPLAFYAKIRDHPFVHFSSTFHQRLENIVRQNHLFRYAPDPREIPQVDWAHGRKLFFWERHPDEIDASGVRGLFPPGNIRSYTFKQLSDQKLVVANNQAPWGSRLSYLKELSRHNIFIAPRKTEGIGLAFLEAMAMGMCVYAMNSPTANEYIHSGRNGVLLAQDTESYVLNRLRSPAEMKAIGQRARKDMYSIHRCWMQDRKKLPGILRNAVRTWRPSPEEILDDPTYFRLLLEQDGSESQKMKFWSYTCRNVPRVFLSVKKLKNWQEERVKHLGIRSVLRYPRKSLLRWLSPRNVLP